MEVVDLTGNSPLLSYRVEVAGKPVPLPRPRANWKTRIFYNPAGRKVTAFKALVKAAIPASRHGAVFPSGVPVAVTITFYMRRPDTDFKRGSRIGGVLKAMVPVMRPISPDLDNLVKFVLDALNGVLFADDSQVVQLTAWKLLDSVGECQGRTVVEVSEFHPNNLL